MDDDPGALAMLAALKAKYKSPAEALMALGLDVEILNVKDKPMRKYDARNRDQESMMDPQMSPDRGGRRSRDEEYEDPEGEETLEELIRELSAQDKRMIHDAVRSLLGQGPDWERAGSDGRRMRRGARDDPPPFYGRPEPGGSMSWSEREAQDRRAGRFANDIATSTGRSFTDMFPDAARIRTTGF